MMGSMCACQRWIQGPAGAGVVQWGVSGPVGGIQGSVGGSLVWWKCSASGGGTIQGPVGDDPGSSM